MLFCLGHIVIFAGFIAHLACIGNHRSYQVIGINHRSLSGLHLSVWQFHHAVREVYEVFAPLEAQLVEQDGQNLEVIVLLIAHNVYHFVNGIILETQLSGADILRHIYRSAVRTQQQLLVQALLGQVCPYAVVIATIEEAFLQAFLHLLFSFEIGV